MEMLFKHQENNPVLSLELSVEHLMQADNGYPICGIQCFQQPYTGTDDLPCVLDHLMSSGTLSNRTLGTFYATGWHQVWIGGWQDLHAELVHSPILSVFWPTQHNIPEDPVGPMPCGTMYVDDAHAILIIGYRYRAADDTLQVQIKNSWGDESQYGYPIYQWIDFPSCNLGVVGFWVLDGISVSDDTTDADGDQIPDYRDLCTGWPSTNRNLDGDTRGDECDPDRDGDHVDDIDDCDADNRFLAYDLDNDGRCDQYDRSTGVPSDALLEHCRTSSCSGTDDSQICGDECLRLAQLAQPGFSLSGCLDQCANHDNCSPTSASPACEDVRLCLNTRTRGSHPACVQGIPIRPDPVDLEQCAEPWANPLQEDSEEPPDGIGDVCDPDPTVGPVDFTVEVTGSGHQFSLTTLRYRRCASDTYEIDFRTHGGTPGNPVTRTGTSVGACQCPLPSWDTNCNFYCSVDTERPASDPTNYAWDPIMASQCDEATYPALDTADNTQSICRNRAFTFPSGNQPANEHHFDWVWQSNHVDWDTGTSLDLTYDSQVPSLVKIRVDWPDGPGDPSAAEKRFVADDQALGMVAGCYEVLDIRNYEGGPLWLIPWGPYFDLPAAQVPGQWWWPRAVGLIRDPVSEVDQLIQFDRSLSSLTAVGEVSYEAGAASPPDALATKAVGAPLRDALFGLGEGSSPGVLLLEESRISEIGVTPARLWLGRISQDQSHWTTASEALGFAAPAVSQGEVTYAPATDEVVLVGRTRQDASVRLWTLPLNPGTWNERGRLDIPAGLQGYRLVHDSLRRRTYIVGGALVSGASWPLLSLLDPATGQVTRLDVTDAVGLTGRADPGVYLDPLSHRIYVYGGREGGVPLSSAGWIDTVTLRTGALADGGGGPGPRVRPFVMYDEKKGALWVSGGDPDETGRVIGFWRADRFGTWSERQVLDPDSLEPGSTDGIFTRDQPVWLVRAVPEGTAWPGQVLVATLTTDSSLLGLRVWDDSGRVIGEDLRPATEHRVAITGLPGQSYSAELVAGTGFGETDTASYTMTIEDGTAMAAGSYAGWSTNAITLLGEVALTTGRRGVEAVDVSDPGAPALMHRVHVPGMGHALTPCGAQALCLGLAHTARKLRTLEVSEQGDLQLLGHVFTPGLGQARGVAYGEGRAYVAAGVLGVQVYDVSDPGSPTQVDSIAGGGLVLDVAWSGGVLYVATAWGGVSVYRIVRGSSPELIGTLPTASHPVALRLAGTVLLVAELDDGHGWLKCLVGLTCRGGDRAEAFDVRADTWGTWLGEWVGDGVSWVYARTLRDYLLVPTASGFSTYQVEVP